MPIGRPKTLLSILQDRLNMSPAFQFFNLQRGKCPLARVYGRPCLYVCLLVTFVSTAKTAKPIEMPFIGADSCGSKEQRARPWAQYRTNPFSSARDDNSAMRPFAQLLWTLVLLPFIACQLGEILNDTKTLVSRPALTSLINPL